MADDIDKSQDIDERMMERTLKNISELAKKFTVRMSCQNCGQKFSPNEARLFCDSDCELDYRRLQANKQEGSQC